jgi:hypothetical protein
MDEFIEGGVARASALPCLMCAGDHQGPGGLTICGAYAA